MHECICLSCKNFKPSFDEEGMVIEDAYECVYDFPSDQCVDCEENMCDLNCDYYVHMDEADTFIDKACASCGKILQVVDNKDNEDGDLYCITCYLENHKE